MACDITCVITGHREGRISVASLRSFQIAVSFARSKGYSIETIFCLDRPDDLTHRIFEEWCGADGLLQIYDFGDQGKVRNEAVTKAKGHYTAFLDADDLWTEDWLVRALVFLADLPDTHIAHPAYNYFFEKQATIFCHVDQESPEFRMDLLRAANYWDALCVCPTVIYREHPFSDRDIANGWAYEDWLWNADTVQSGKIHKVVPDTVIFKRRQKASQTIRAGENKSMIHVNAFSRYDNPMFSTGKNR